MPTTTDLRQVLHDRAEEASAAPPPVDAAIQGARRIRTRRGLGVAVGALAVVAAIVVPTAVGWPGADRTPPVAPPSTPGDGRVLSTSGRVWAPALPGLDLSAGAPLQIPYAFDTVVVAGTVRHEMGGVVRRLLEAPEGLVALVDVGPTTPDANGPHLATRVVLISEDGSGTAQQELDRGYIFSISSSTAGDGPTRVAWTWTDIATGPNPKEVRAIDLGPGAAVKSLPLQGFGRVWTFDGQDPILELEQQDSSSFARWEIDSGALVPLSENFSSMIVATDRLEFYVAFDETTECTSGVAAAQPDAPLWKRCDLLVQTLSPDGALAFGSFFSDGSVGRTADRLAVVDVKTGADIGALDLPPSGGAELGSPREPSFQWFVESWEPDGSALVLVSYEGLPGEDADTNVAPFLHTMVRCSVTSGDCEQVPHPVEVAATHS